MGLFSLPKREWTRTSVAGGTLSFELPMEPRRMELKKQGIVSYTCQVQPPGASQMDMVTYNVSVASSSGREPTELLMESVGAIRAQAKGDVNYEKIAFQGHPGLYVDVVIRGQRSRYVSYAFPDQVLTLSAMQREGAKVIPEDDIARVFGSVQAPGYAPLATAGPPSGQPVSAPSPHVTAPPSVGPASPASGWGGPPAPPGSQPATQGAGFGVSPQPAPPITPQIAPQATGPDQVIAPGELTPDRLRSILDAAYLQTRVDANGNLTVVDGISCVVRMESAAEILRLISVFSIQRGDELAQLRFANQANTMLVAVRAAVRQGTLTFDASLPAAGGLSPRAIVTAVRGFVSAVQTALANDSEGILR